MSELFATAGASFAGGGHVGQMRPRLTCTRRLDGAIAHPEKIHPVTVREIAGSDQSYRRFGQHRMGMVFPACTKLDAVPDRVCGVLLRGPHHDVMGVHAAAIATRMARVQSVFSGRRLTTRQDDHGLVDTHPFAVESELAVPLFRYRGEWVVDASDRVDVDDGRADPIQDGAVPCTSSERVTMGPLTPDVTIAHSLLVDRFPAIRDRAEFLPLLAVARLVVMRGTQALSHVRRIASLKTARSAHSTIIPVTGMVRARSQELVSASSTHRGPRSIGAMKEI